MAHILERLSAALSDRYRIERELGRGGMATVFLAEDLRHHRRVALKVLDPELGSAIGPERFLREIETVARLTHPHILPMHDSGQAAGLLYYAMPYVEGESLRARLAREKQLPLEDALSITREVADALGYAHAHGVVHRDIKPENILLESGHAVVADFGIARAISSPEGRTLVPTPTGVAVGTPAYMSPEQAVGSHDLDGRSDLYSLACVAYEMLAGQPPFTGPTAESLVQQHLNVAPRPVTELRPAAPVSVRAALQRALEKTPADRFATAEAFVAALAASEPAPSARAIPNRRRGALWVAAVVLLMAGVVAVVATLQRGGTTSSQRGAAARRDWILVADFEGPPGDSTVAPAARSLLSAALDQSKIVATVPKDQIQVALERAGRPKTARLDPTLAREIAYRSSVRAVLEGSVDRIGRGYSIVVRVADADTARTILTRSVTAKDENALIPALGEMAKELRRGLGENPAALAATRPISLVATPSFEAYQLYVQAGARYSRGTGNRRYIRDLRDAIALDPEFATAWLSLAAPYHNLGYDDSALACVNEAARYPLRLSPRQRASIERWRAGLQGDHRGELAAYDQILADNPGDINALANSNDDLWHLGRVEEALARTRQAIALSPFGPADAMRVNETASLEFLRRFDEARAANRKQTGIFAGSMAIEIEVAAGRFSAAESLIAASRAGFRATEDFEEGQLGLLSDVGLGRGAVDEAAAADNEAIEACTRANDPVGVNVYRLDLPMLYWLTSSAIDLPPAAGSRDSSALALLTDAAIDVAKNELGPAAHLLSAARARPPVEMNGLDLLPTLLEANIATLSGRPMDAVRQLRPILPPGWALGVNQVWVAWSLADAFEKAGMPDSAAAYLERTQGIPYMAADGAEQPYVERRLAVLDARLGRVADAERHLAAAERALDRADAHVRQLLDQARAAVAAARAGKGTS